MGEPATKEDLGKLEQLIVARMDPMASDIGEIKEQVTRTNGTVRTLCEWRVGVDKDLAYLQKRTEGLPPPPSPASTLTPPAPTPRQKREPGPSRLTVREFLLLAFGIAIVASGATAALLKAFTLIVK